MTKWRGRPVTCSCCGLPGGTMVKVSEGKPDVYAHQNRVKCAILQFRKKSPKNKQEVSM